MAAEWFMELAMVFKDKFTCRAPKGRNQPEKHGWKGAYWPLQPQRDQEKAVFHGKDEIGECYNAFFNRCCG